MPSNSDHLVASVREFVSRHEIRDTRLLVSVSGGPDSTALLRLLFLMRNEFRLTLRVAHFNHGLRPESEDEARWVIELCERIGVEVQIESLPVTEGAPPTMATGIEERARTLRYQALESLASQHGCPFVAVGHTLDDQVETVLQRMMRGTGLWGLAGIRECRSLGTATLVRPLLQFHRTEIEDWLRSSGQPWCEDSSNRDLRFSRNRIRHELLPGLRTHFNPQVDRHIADLADHVREVMKFIECRSRSLRDSALLESQPTLQKWDAGKLRESESFLRCEAIRHEWRNLRWSELGMTKSHWEAIANLCDVPPPAALSVPGPITASRRGNLLVIEQSADPPLAQTGMSGAADIHR